MGKRGISILFIWVLLFCLWPGAGLGADKKRPRSNEEIEARLESVDFDPEEFTLAPGEAPFHRGSPEPLPQEVLALLDTPRLAGYQVALADWSWENYYGGAYLVMRKGEENLLVIAHIWEEEGWKLSLIADGLLPPGEALPTIFADVYAILSINYEAVDGALPYGLSGLSYDLTLEGDEWTRVSVSLERQREGLPAMVADAISFNPTSKNRVEVFADTTTPEHWEADDPCRFYWSYRKERVKMSLPKPAGFDLETFMEKGKSPWRYAPFPSDEAIREGLGGT